MLMAGGDIAPKLSPIADIPDKTCKTDKIYVEEDTDLMWQDQAYIDAEDGAYKQEGSRGKVGNWKYAQNYCYRLDYAGYTDWKLPTSDELQHVHRKEGQVFAYFRGEDFWSSTPRDQGEYYAVYPADAYRYGHKMKRSNYIRCVRCIIKGES